MKFFKDKAGEVFAIEKGDTTDVSEMTPISEKEARALSMPDIETVRAGMQVSAFQAHAAIHRAGLYDAVQALMDDPNTDFEVKLAWDRALYFGRLSPSVLAMGSLLNLSDQKLDDLFALAATIEA